jgi:hypothetical protein
MHDSNVQHFPSKHDALSLILSTAKKKGKKREKGRDREREKEMK